MAISLSKGQKVDLTKSNPGLTNVVVGLGWDTNKYDGGNDFDLDSSVFLLGENGKVTILIVILYFTIIQMEEMVRLYIMEIIVQVKVMAMTNKRTLI